MYPPSVVLAYPKLLALAMAQVCHTCFGYFRSPFSFCISVFSTWGILGLSTKKSSPPIDMLII